MEVRIFCPIYGMEDDFVEHAVLHCARVRVIWRPAIDSPWEMNTGPWLDFFLT